MTMMERLKYFNKKVITLPDTVTDMWIGTVIFAIICELVGIWFTRDKMGYTIGLWLGAALACACAYHMWVTLDRSFDIDDPKSAGRYAGGRYLIRYAALIILITVLYFTHIGNPFAAFLGYMGMKAAAYMQPTIHRFINRHKQTEVI